MRSSSIVLCSLLVVIAACGRDPAPAEAKLEALTAQQLEQSKAEKSAKTKAGLREGPATKEPISGPDPCALIGKNVLRSVLGDAPTTVYRRRVNNSFLDTVDSSVVCEWQSSGGRAELKLGSKLATKDLLQENAESVAGLGDEAWLETGYERQQRLRVRLGERYLVVKAGINGDQRAAMMSMAKEAITALPNAPELANRLPLGDVVGAAAVKPCDLMSAEVLTKVVGGGSYMTLPEERIGDTPGRNYVECAWNTWGGGRVTVSLHDAAYWNVMAKSLEPTKAIAGHEALLRTGNVDGLVARFDGWALEVRLDSKAPVAVRREHMVMLAEAVIAELR